MPRPQRIRDREKGVVGDNADADAGAEATPAAPLNRKDEAGLRRTLRVGSVQLLEPDEGVETRNVDNASQSVEPSRTGQVADGDPVQERARRVAMQTGWVPKEEWKRSPKCWTDWPDFLEGLPKRLETQSERLRRMGQVAEDQAEQARREGLAEARRELDTAIQSGDTDAATKAADRLAKNVGPPPQTVAWIGRNGWFNTDPDAQGIAANAMRRAERAGATIEEQLQAGEAAARKRFPEHFDDIQPIRREDLRPEPAAKPEPQREVRLSQVQPPPNLTGGSRAGGREAPKEKGWMDIPNADRTQMTQFVRRAMRQGQSEKQATDFLARSYWDLKA